MPVQTDSPVSSGSETQWKIYPGGVASRIVAVRTNDGDSSVVYAVSNSSPKKQTFNFSPLAGIADPVNDATLTAVARNYAGGTGAQTFKLMWNGTGINAPNVTYGFARGHLSTAYATCALSSPDIPNLGLVAVNGEHGFWMRGTGGYEVFVTYFARAVDFDYAGSDFVGPFAHNMATLAGAAIGGGLLLREMPALARFMARWKLGRSWLLRPDEYDKAWRAWREYAHPRFVFL